MSGVLVGVKSGVNMLTDSVSSAEDMGMSLTSDLVGVGVMKGVADGVNSGVLSMALDVNESNSIMLLEASSTMGNDVIGIDVSEVVTMLVKIKLVSDGNGLGLNVLTERDSSDVGNGISKFVVLIAVGATEVWML